MSEPRGGRATRAVKTTKKKKEKGAAASTGSGARAPRKASVSRGRAGAGKKGAPRKAAAPRTTARKAAAPRKTAAKRTTARKTAAPRYPFVAVDVREAYAGDIAALLFANGASGVEERDDQTLRRGPGHGTVTVVGAFATHDAARVAMKAVRASRPILRPRLEEIVGDAWRDAWKEHFAPFALTPRVTIAPPWSVPAAAPGTHVLVLEPGRAFGTGLHASTSLVASLLEERAASFAGQAVLDVGTGSGILALVALVLGAARADALDVDEEAVAVARENAERNGLSERLRVRAGSAADAAGLYPLVLANIEARILLPMAEDLAARVAPGGTLVLSGILEGERDSVVRRYEALGLAHARTVTRGEAAGEAWIAIALARPAR